MGDCFSKPSDDDARPISTRSLKHKNNYRITRYPTNIVQNSSASNVSGQVTSPLIFNHNNSGLTSSAIRNSIGSIDTNQKSNLLNQNNDRSTISKISRNLSDTSNQSRNVLLKNDNRTIIPRTSTSSVFNNQCNNVTTSPNTIPNSSIPSSFSTIGNSSNQNNNKAVTSSTVQNPLILSISNQSKNTYQQKSLSSTQNSSKLTNLNQVGYQFNQNNNGTIKSNPISTAIPLTKANISVIGLQNSNVNRSRVIGKNDGRSRGRNKNYGCNYSNHSKNGRSRNQNKTKFIPTSADEKFKNRKPKFSEPEIRLLKLVFQDDFNNDDSIALLKLKELGSTIKLLSKDEPNYEMICKYVQNSQGPTHPFKVSIEHIYVGYRWGKLKDFKPLKKLGNRKLLWHGTAISNYASILSSGLLTLPPSNVSLTGKMFGNGIYFADAITKSAQYCKADRSNPYGVLILAQVALGKEYILTRSENVTKLPDGKNCVKGLGRYQHKESENFRTKYGVEVPCGRLELRRDINSTLLYNEYVVYNPEQILFEYLVLLKFDF